MPDVLHVEKILNQGQANVLGKSTSAYKQMEMLAGQAESGLFVHEAFGKNPKNYVDLAYLTRMNVKDGRPFKDNVPYDPVRSALTEFRKELTQELTPRKGNPFPESAATDKMRFDATVKAERDYLEEILSHRKNEPEEKKLEHLQIFDKRMEKLARQIKAPQQGK